MSIHLKDIELDFQTFQYLNPHSVALRKGKYPLLLWKIVDNEAMNNWTKMMRDNTTKSTSKPPKRVIRKVDSLAKVTKKKIGESIMSSSLGNYILKDMVSEEVWVIIETMKDFVRREYKEKASKKLYNRCVKLIVKLALLSKEGTQNSLPLIHFIVGVIEDWSNLVVAFTQLFSMAIDSHELSFCFDADGLVVKIQELHKAFEAHFGGKDLAPIEMLI
jgi:uncharacterized protein YeeX (DUF496 family)